MRSLRYQPLHREEGSGNIAVLVNVVDETFTALWTSTQVTKSIAHALAIEVFINRAVSASTERGLDHSETVTTMLVAGLLFYGEPKA